MGLGQRAELYNIMPFWPGYDIIPKDVAILILATMETTGQTGSWGLHLYDSANTVLSSSTW